MPNEKRKISLVRGFSGDELKAASINQPKINAADTSITPVSMEKIEDTPNIKKLPLRDQFMKPNKFLGGSPLDGDIESIILCGFILNKFPEKKYEIK